MEAWSLACFTRSDLEYFVTDTHFDSPGSTTSCSTMESASDIPSDPEVILAQLRALQLQTDVLTPPTSATPQSSGPYSLFSAPSSGMIGAATPNLHLQPPPLLQQPNSIIRTVYINGLDPFQTEAELIAFFSCCGAVSDCRICSNINQKATRFGFVEFEDDASALRALSLTGSVLRDSPISVFPSKTAIVPIKNLNMPRSEEERAAVARTVYVCNIHRAIERDHLHYLFSVMGAVTKLRLLGDEHHETKIAFIEFSTREGAAMALLCSGMVLNDRALRVSPSKTPVKMARGRKAGA